MWRWRWSLLVVALSGCGRKHHDASRSHDADVQQRLPVVALVIDAAPADGGAAPADGGAAPADGGAASADAALVDAGYARTGKRIPVLMRFDSTWPAQGYGDFPASAAVPDEETKRNPITGTQLVVAYDEHACCEAPSTSVLSDPLDHVFWVRVYQANFRRSSTEWYGPFGLTVAPDGQPSGTLVPMAASTRRRLAPIRIVDPRRKPDQRITDTSEWHLLEYRDQLRACYRGALAASPKLDTRLDIELTLKQSKIESARITARSTKSQALERCVLETIVAKSIPDPRATSEVEPVIIVFGVTEPRSR